MEKHFSDCCSDEKCAIDIWMECHIRYQEQLNKCMIQTIKTIPDRNKNIYKGCPICDNIIEVFNIKFDTRSCEKHDLLVKDININHLDNKVNHINHHLRYYPYECLLCKNENKRAQKRGQSDKDVVKTAVQAMMRRHIIDRHLKVTDIVGSALEKEIEKSIKLLKVLRLEEFAMKQSESKNLQSQTIFKKSSPGPTSF